MVYSHGCVRDKTDTALASANLGSRDRRRILSCWRVALLAKPGLRLTRCRGGGRNIQVQPHARHPPSSLAGRQRNHKGRGSAISPLNRAWLVLGAARQGRTAGLWDAYTFGELEPRPARPRPGPGRLVRMKVIHGTQGVLFLAKVSQLVSTYSDAKKVAYSYTCSSPEPKHKHTSQGMLAA